MKKDVYQRLLGLQTARRRFLQGSAGVGAAAAMGGLGGWPLGALAQGDVRSEMLTIPGVGMGSPTDADYSAVALERSDEEEVFEDLEQLEREVARLEKKMLRAADRLEFELAAECRDRIAYLRKRAVLS